MALRIRWLATCRRRRACHKGDNRQSFRQNLWSSRRRLCKCWWIKSHACIRWRVEEKERPRAKDRSTDIDQVPRRVNKVLQWGLCGMLRWISGALRENSRLYEAIETWSELPRIWLVDWQTVPWLRGGSCLLGVEQHFQDVGWGIHLPKGRGNR